MKRQRSAERQRVASKAHKHFTFILSARLAFTLLQSPPHHMTFVDFPESVPMSCFFLILEWNDLCPCRFLSEVVSPFKSYCTCGAFLDIPLVAPKVKINYSIPDSLHITCVWLFKALIIVYSRVVLSVFLSPFQDSTFLEKNNSVLLITRFAPPKTSDC